MRIKTQEQYEKIRSQLIGYLHSAELWFEIDEKEWYMIPKIEFEEKRRICGHIVNMLNSLAESIKFCQGNERELVMKMLKKFNKLQDMFEIVNAEIKLSKFGGKISDELRKQLFPDLFH